MKRITLMLIVVVLLCYPNPFAQTVTESKGVFIGGLSLDAGTFSGVAGVGVKAGPIWTFLYKDVNKYGEANLEFAKFIKIRSNFHISPVAGPGIDWEPGEDVQASGDITAADIHSYIFGATGIVAAWELSPKAGLWGYWRARFKLEDQNKSNSFVSDGYQAGFGFFVRLGG